jgi:myosin-5
MGAAFLHFPFAETHSICPFVFCLSSQLEAARQAALAAEEARREADERLSRLADVEQELAQANSELSDAHLARQQKIRNDMEKDERIAELEARIQTMQMQALQAGEGAPAAEGASLKVADGALPLNAAPEEADILRATVAALKAQLASAKRELSTRHAAVAPAPSKTGEGDDAGDTDAPHTTSTDEDDRGAAAARAAEAEEELYELRERVAVLNKELIELKAENRELLVAGVSSPVPQERAIAGTGGSTEENVVSEAAQVEPRAGGDASPRAGSADAYTNEEQETALEALEQSLLRARTDIARLQLANTKLVAKLQTMEKTNVASEAKLKRLGGDSDTESLRSNLGKLREQVESLRQERKGLVPAAELSKAQEGLKAAEVRLQALQNDYDSFMGEHCMLDLAKAKTDLQQRNHALQEETQSLRSRITDFQADAKAAQAEIEELKTERKAMREHMDNLKQALAKKLPAPGSGGSGGGSGADGSLLQEEVRALINENLGMRETIEELEAKVATLEGALEEARQGLPASGASGGLGRASSATSMASTTGGSGGGAGGAMQGAAAAQAVQYKGMLKFREKDIQRVVSALVLRMGPSSLPQALPGLPAHLLFMCVLYADHVENAAMLSGLLTKAMTAMKQVVMQNAADIDVLAYWLSNGYRLLSNMKQFSGEPQFKTRDDELSLTLNTFDLQEYRIVLSDLLVQIYHTVFKHVEVQLLPMIVPGMLDYESLPGAGSAAAAGGRRGGQSGGAGGKPAAKVDDIVRLFNSVLQALQRQCVEPRLVQHVFKQLFYVVNANMVNNLLLRKDLARLTKGMQVRYNISKLQDWARDNSLEQIGSALIEAVQITQLLQCNKTKADDVDTIFATCVNLNPLQIQKVLTMYTPEEFESRVPAALLRAVHERESQAKGGRGPSEGGAAKLLMDTGYMFSVTFPFTPSTPKFPTLELPADLELDFVEKI